eukprot:scaffold37942_cov57-Phaeocystis_antarctica.AAC.4
MGNGERAGVSTGADTKANTLGAAAHLRLVIFVSLRTAASAVAPSAPIVLPPTLRARCRMGNGERVGVSMGADTKANTRESVRAPGGLLQRLQHRVTLEALRESGSSFGTKTVELETARTGTEVGAEWCQRALT